jgi:LacI family transcriptional regulator, galactose operon repressor
MKRRNSVTIKDVARLAGVAQVTAARTLGGYGLVSAKSRQRVLAAAEQLGYYADAVARSMVTRTTQTLGLVVSDIQNIFFAGLARAVADVARQRGYALVLANTDEDLDREREAVRVLAEKRVDGLIVVPASGTYPSHLDVLTRHHVPIVLLDRSLPELDVDTIMVDNATAAYNAIQHLSNLGHRRVGMITASTTIATCAARIAGYRKALAEVGVHDTMQWLRVVEDNQVSAEAETGKFLALPEGRRPTAIFATDSILTASAFRAIQATGLTIPTDVSLIGFDDVDWMSMVRPAVTVVEQPVRELGKRAAERLIGRIEGDESPAQMVCLEAELILRGSTAVPASGRAPVTIEPHLRGAGT